MKVGMCSLQDVNRTYRSLYVSVAVWGISYSAARLRFSRLCGLHNFKKLLMKSILTELDGPTDAVTLTLKCNIYCKMTTAAVAGWCSGYEVSPTTGSFGRIPLFRTVFVVLVLLGKILNKNQYVLV